MLHLADDLTARRTLLAAVVLAVTTLVAAAFAFTHTSEPPRRLTAIGCGPARSELESSRLGYGNPHGEPLPAECEHYRQEVREIEQCGQLPAGVAQVLDQSLKDIEASIPTLPPEALTTVRDACKTSSESLAQAKQALCASNPDAQAR